MKLLIDMNLSPSWVMYLVGKTSCRQASHRDSSLSFIGLSRRSLPPLAEATGLLNNGRQRAFSDVGGVRILRCAS